NSTWICLLPLRQISDCLVTEEEFCQCLILISVMMICRKMQFTFMTVAHQVNGTIRTMYFFTDNHLYNGDIIPHKTGLRIRQIIILIQLFILLLLMAEQVHPNVFSKHLHSM